MATFISIDEAKEIIVANGLRPLEQRGFYSHFIRAIDDTRTYDSVTAEITKNGMVRKSALLRAIENKKLRDPPP